ncbi:MAG TPA: iron ABC transporter permease [Bacillota bacterium]|nr:iron ABC transporter permease [Bacillota bacterium]
MGLNKPRRVMPLLWTLLLAMLIISMANGAVSIPVSRIWDALSEILTSPSALWSSEATILWRLRIPRALLAAVVGAGLATAGAVLQGLLRNGLADSYVLGVSSGASLGAALAMLMGLRLSFFGLGSVTPAAFIGATLTLFAVVFIARRMAGNSTLGLLLAGIAMSSFLSAIVSMLVFFSRERIQPIIFWTMGGFGARSWNHLLAVTPYMLIGYAVAFLLNRQLTAISLGDETAHHLGVNVPRTRLVLLGASALLTAAAVSVSGVIGFVGLMIPHMARMVSSHNYRRLLPTSALLGATFLVAADLIARVIVKPAELPVGIITALCGGPFFIYLLSKRKREV